MPNICTNKVVVTGPAGDVARFVEAAVGRVSEEEVGSHSTEMRIIREVDEGMGVDDAFRNANLRLDAMNHRLTTLPLDYDLSGEPILPKPADYQSWKQEVYDSARAHELMMEREGSVKGMASQLSFPRLVPMPEDVKRESWRLAAYCFSLSEWGPKFFFGPIGAPKISDVPTFGGDGTSGEATAVYPLFDTPNSPVFHGLLNASKDHPGLLLLSGFVDQDTDEFMYYACKAGETLAEGALEDIDSLPDSCFETEDGERFLLTSEALNHLTETAAIEASGHGEAPTP